MEFEIGSESQLPQFAKQLIEFAGASRCFLFEAPMGAGKTTFIKELCRQLGSHNSFSSPTYPIVNEYDYPGGKIYHFDLFRIKTVAELADIGFEEYLYSGHYCFIEWPAVAHDLVHSRYVKVEIEPIGNIRYFRANISGT